MNNKYKDPEYHKKYYQAHKAEISAKEITLIYRALTCGFQEITKVLWWIAFAISFVGLAELFK